MSKTGFYSKKDKPQNYYRSGIVTNDFRLAMEGSGWLTLTQLVGIMSDKIPPEAKARYAQLHNNGKIKTGRPLSNIVAGGCRDIIRSKMQNLIWRKKVERHGSGNDAKYRWIESEDTTARQDTA